MSDMISKWFFASFRTPSFVFFYDDQEPRLWGAFKRPPSRRWKIQRPSRAQVKITSNVLIKNKNKSIGYFIWHFFSSQVCTSSLYLARSGHFSTWTVGGGGLGPPGDRPLVVAELRGKTFDASRRDLAIAHIVFSPRSTFDLVRSGQRAILALHAHSGVSPVPVRSMWGAPARYGLAQLLFLTVYCLRCSLLYFSFSFTRVFFLLRIKRIWIQVPMCRGDLKPSPACSLFNSEHDRVSLLYPVAIFGIRR